MKRAKTLELPVADGLEIFDVAVVEVMGWIIFSVGIVACFSGVCDILRHR